MARKCYVVGSTCGAGRLLRAYMWRWKLLMNLLQNCLSPDGQGRPYSWQHISSLMNAKVPRLEKRPNQKHICMGHIIGKSLYGFLCTCGGWPAWPVKGSLMLKISQVRVSPILQERESDVDLLCMQCNKAEVVMF